MTQALIDYYNNTAKPILGCKTWEDLEKIECGPCIIKHVGKQEDVGYACLFFACNESSYCTGTNIMIDGGYSSL